MARGGKRTGAGRPKGSGKYRESTKLARVPHSVANRLTELAGEPLLIVPTTPAAAALTQAEQALQTIQQLQPTLELERIAQSLVLLRQALGLQPQACLSFRPRAWEIRSAAA